MNTKEGCLTPPGTLRIWQNVGDLRGKKVWYILPVPGRFLENMGTHVFCRKGVPHTTRQLSGLWKNWAPSVDFFYGHNPKIALLYLWQTSCLVFIVWYHNSELEIYHQWQKPWATGKNDLSSISKNLVFYVAKNFTESHCVRDLIAEIINWFDNWYFGSSLHFDKTNGITGRSASDGKKPNPFRLLRFEFVSQIRTPDGLLLPGTGF